MQRLELVGPDSARFPGEEVRLVVHQGLRLREQLPRHLGRRAVLRYDDEDVLSFEDAGVPQAR